jgi:amino acid adenylation domain-containing protein
MNVNMFTREEPVNTGPSRQITDLDGLPVPDRSLVDYEKYSRYIGLTMARNTLSIQATRGCPYNCAYCHKIWPKTHQYRSAENILEEIRYHYKIGVRRFAFIDDVFNLNGENSQRFFREVNRSGMDIQIYFSGALRVDIMTPEQIDRMVEAGTVNISFALETASPRLQRYIGKHLNLGKMEEITQYICETYPQVITELHTMHGFPTETEEEALQTLDFIKRFKWLHFPYINILKVYPNTEMANLAQESGITRDAIRRSCDLAWHQLPETLPFDKSFTMRYQADYLENYFLNRERLKQVLPYQQEVLTQEELLQKYNSYLPQRITRMEELKTAFGLEEIPKGAPSQSARETYHVPDWNRKNREQSTVKEPTSDALRILLLDLSQEQEAEEKGNDERFERVVEPPLGLMYLLTYLNRRFGSKIHGKIAKAMIDFNGDEQMKALIDDMKPDVIGIRTLTYYKKNFHRAVARIREWGMDGPIIAGGPYATSDYMTVMRDPNVDLVVQGEGEITLTRLLEEIMVNDGTLPEPDRLRGIPGIVYMQGDRRKERRKFGENRRAELKVAAAQRNKEKEYWLRQLAGTWERAAYPEDNTRENPDYAEDPVEEEIIVLSGAVLERLDALSKRNDRAQHLILQTAQAIMVYRYTGENDIVIGEPVEIRRPGNETNDYINTVRPIRYRIEPEESFKDHLIRARKTQKEAQQNQGYPVELLPEQLNRPEGPKGFPLFDILQQHENLHDGQIQQHIRYNMQITQKRRSNPGEQHIVVAYNAARYRRETVSRINRHYLRLLEQLMEQLDRPVGNIDGMTDRERKQQLLEYNRTEAPYPANKTIHRLFMDQQERTPHRVAVEDGEHKITYRELERRSNRYARYLKEEHRIQQDARVGIMMDRSPAREEAMLGVLKAGGAYVPIPTGMTQPRRRILHMIEDAGITVILSERKHTHRLNRLQWECPSLKSFFLCDTTDVDAMEPEVEEEIANQSRLWEYVGETATDDITGGGWLTSDTGEPFTPEEMAEYGDNVLEKLRPHLHKEMNVLEIGVATGLTMYRVAPLVREYTGTDLSHVIIQWNREKIEAEGISNIRLECMPAHEIENHRPRDYDLVIINSVVQSFPGHNYLRRVIRGAVSVMKPKGLLFIGDVMDQDQKNDLIRDMEAYKQHNRDMNPPTKTDWSAELFLSRQFFMDQRYEVPGIIDVETGRKYYTIENELTRYRYDALMTVDKGTVAGQPVEPGQRNKIRHDLRNLENFNFQPVEDDVTAQQLAYIIYTSGTTGVPRGVMTEHQNAVNVLTWFGRTYRLGSQSRVIQMTGATFDPSVEQIFSTLQHGGTVCRTPTELAGDSDGFREYVQQHQLNMINYVPTALAVMLPKEAPRIPALETVISGGEALEESLKNRLIEKGYTLYNQYGPTETTIDALYARCTRRGETVLGTPVANTRVYIMDGNLQPVPQGALGELCIAGNGVARGYLNNPEQTAERFVESPITEDRLYRTGDWARRLTDGTIRYYGRIDRQVKIRGNRIELEEIERHLEARENVKQAAVTVIRSGSAEGGDLEICAYVVPDGQLEQNRIRESLSETLPEYMVPQLIVPMEAFPITPGGKIDCRALPKPKKTTAGKYRAPSGAIEEHMVRIWADVLGLEKGQISADADFFDLGGHSLKATILVARVHKELKVRLPLAEVFKIPTVAGLSRYIRENAGNTLAAMVPAPKKEFYVLSHAQRRIYVHQQLNTGSTLYNMPETYRLKLETPEDEQKVLEIFRRLIKRHEALRTSFVMKDGEPMQKIHPQVEFEIERIDGNSERFVRPFDMATAPLLRVGIEKNAPAEAIMMVDMHHIICDAISHQVLMADAEAFSKGKKLTPLRLQYKDYAEWQNRYRETMEMAKQEAYWKKQLENLPPELRLPLDKPRPEIQDFTGEQMRFEIEDAVTSRIKTQAAEAGVTPNIILQTVTNVLLWKYTGQEDIVIGFPITGRHHADLEKIIGMFVNMLPLRSRPQGDKTYRQYLEEVKEKNHDAYENQDYPFDRLVAQQGIKRDLSRNPLFDVVFTNQTPTEASPEKTTRIGLDSPSMPAEGSRGISRFDLHIVAAHKDNHFEMYLEYAAALFKRSTAEKMVERYMEILNQVLENPELLLKDIQLAHDLEMAEVKTSRQQELSFRL